MQSKKFRHYILTRFNTQYVDGKLLYDRSQSEANEWMEDRMKLFAQTQESVLSQNGEFTWVISLDLRTPDVFYEKIAIDDRVKIIPEQVQDVFKTRAIIPDTPFVITSRLDNDDVYLPGAVERIQEYFAPKVGVIDIDYYQYDTETGKKYTSERKTPNSPFLSLVEPTKKAKTCFCRPHSYLYMGYPVTPNDLKMIRATKIHEILAWMVIHGNNVSNKVVGVEVQE